MRQRWRMVAPARLALACVLFLSFPPPRRLSPPRDPLKAGLGCRNRVKMRGKRALARVPGVPLLRWRGEEEYRRSASSRRCAAEPGGGGRDRITARVEEAAIGQQPASMCPKTGWKTQGQVKSKCFPKKKRAYLGPSIFHKNRTRSQKSKTRLQQS